MASFSWLPCKSADVCCPPCVIQANATYCERIFSSHKFQCLVQLNIKQLTWPLCLQTDHPGFSLWCRLQVMREFNLATLSTGARGYATHLNIQVPHSHATDQDFRSVGLFVYSLRCVRLTNHVWAGFSWMQVTVHGEREIGRMHWPKIQSQKPPAIVWQCICFSLH